MRIKRALLYNTVYFNVNILKHTHDALPYILIFQYNLDLLHTTHFHIIYFFKLSNLKLCPGAVRCFAYSLSFTINREAILYGEKLLNGKNTQ